MFQSKVSLCRSDLVKILNGEEDAVPFQRQLAEHLDNGTFKDHHKVSISMTLTNFTCPDRY